MPTAIPEDVLEVLARSAFDDAGLKLPGTPGAPDALPRPLYEKTNKVLLACGLKWDRKAGRHVGNAVELVEQALLTGEFTDAKKEFEAFYTPPALAAQVVARARIPAYGVPVVLEPSAGEGALVGAVLDHCPTAAVWVCEKNPATRAKLRGRYPDAFGRTMEGDFLAISPADHVPFDHVVMNPPFSRGQDAAHVMHALQFLAPKGRLVSIMSPGLRFRGDGQYRLLRERLAEGDLVASIEDLPEGSFKSSGTGVRTILLTVDWQT